MLIIYCGLMPIIIFNDLVKFRFNPDLLSRMHEAEMDEDIFRGDEWTGFVDKPYYQLKSGITQPLLLNNLKIWQKKSCWSELA